jgi:hypothetical protein
LEGVLPYVDRIEVVDGCGVTRKFSKTDLASRFSGARTSSDHFLKLAGVKVQQTWNTYNKKEWKSTEINT